MADNSGRDGREDTEDEGPPSKRPRSDGEAEAGARPVSGDSDVSEGDRLDAADDDELAGAAGYRGNWVDLDGCTTLEDVRRVVHARFKTSQDLLDYIQTYKVILSLWCLCQLPTQVLTADSRTPYSPHHTIVPRICGC